MLAPPKGKTSSSCANNNRGNTFPFIPIDFLYFLCFVRRQKVRKSLVAKVPTEFTKEALSSRFPSTRHPQNSAVSCQKHFLSLLQCHCQCWHGCMTLLVIAIVVNMIFTAWYTASCWNRIRKKSRKSHVNAFHTSIRGGWEQACGCRQQPPNHLWFNFRRIETRWVVSH